MISNRIRKVALLLLCGLAGCGHQSDGSVLMSADNDYQMLSLRYAALDESDDVVASARLIGQEVSLSFGSALWQSCIGNDHLFASEGTPLHRAAFVMDRDIARLARHAQNLERRCLAHIPIYQLINELRVHLCSVLRIIQSQQEYTQESQFIEQQRVHKAQLSEARYQSALLTHKTHHHTTVVERHNHHHHHTAKHKTVIVNA